MKKRAISITEFDKARLEELISVAEDFGGHARNDLEMLANELKKAKVVPSHGIHPDVVTMNSRIVLEDVATGETTAIILAFPKDADIDLGAISVLAPVGTAILGYAKGDEIEWPVPSGTRRFVIKEILYQPEASGDYHL